MIDFKPLKVPFISSLNKDISLDSISVFLNCLDKNDIAFSPWPQFDYKPETAFVMAYGEDCIFLKYFVTEEDIKACYRQINDPVFRDSCVEFFIAFDGEEQYYNFEFNCIGTCLAGYGTQRSGRKLLPAKSIEKIKAQTLIANSNSENGALISWELTLVIPFDVFCYQNISSLEGRSFRTNFYKCGDDLPKPHFLSWAPIQSEIPDFHLPGFFGKAVFLKKEVDLVSDLNPIINN
jgi:hypothetical protein